VITHILKKDIRLLWPMAALVAGLQLSATIAHHVMDHSSAPSQQLVIIATILSLLALLGGVVVVILAMHQDPVPGVRQDWLTRPIRRRDLIFAKLLFAVVMVHLPLWLVALFAMLADGISLPAAILGASGSGLATFCEFTLPAIMIGAVTRNFIEAFVAATIGLLAYVFIFGVVFGSLLRVKASIGGTGVAWVIDAAFYTLTLLGAAATLGLQYFRRRTTLSRWLVGAGGAAVIACGFLPWSFAFGLQQQLSPQPQSAGAISLAFDPQRARYPLPRGAAPYLNGAYFIPLQVKGLPPSATLVLDRADLRITSIDGALLYEGRSNISIDGVGSISDAGLEVRSIRAAGQDPGVYERVYLPPDVSARLGNQPVRIGVNYSLTVFEAAASYSMPAVGGQETLGALGRCATKIDADGDDVRVSCLSALRQPTCLTAYLEQPSSGLKNAEMHGCQADYTPPFFAQFWPDAINRTNRELRFFDRSGHVHFPVDGSRIADSRLMIQTFVPSDHFTRHLDTPAVRLPELRGVAAAGEGQHQAED
jgi:hypothetical protein